MLRLLCLSGPSAHLTSGRELREMRILLVSAVRCCFTHMPYNAAG